MPLTDAKDGAYHSYNLGARTLTQGMYVWVAPPADATVVTHVYVDRIFLVREPE